MKIRHTRFLVGVAFSLFLVVFSVTIGTVGAFEGGSGTEDDPYQIANVEQLQAMEENLDAHYILVNDIDAGGTLVWNDGGFDPIGDAGNNGKGFTGSFNGQGYVIRGLYIARPGEKYVGLFGFTKEGSRIENVGVENISVNGKSYVGGLIGLNRGSVVNSHAAGGSVLCQEMFGGMLIGVNQGSVDKCYSSGGKASDVRYPSGGVASDAPGMTNYIGGLVGKNYGSISRSYSTASVSGAWGVGGLVGGCSGRISNSYSTGSVILGCSEFRFKYIGGLVGYNSDAWEKNVSNSFWDIETSGMDESAGGTGLTAQEMRETETFTNTATKGLNKPWDFVGNPNNDTEDKDIWNIDESGKINDGYPYLTGLERRGEGLAQYELSTSVNPSSGGSVSLEPPRRTYDEETEVTITAEPTKGYEFDQWKGDYPAGERESNSVTVAMDSDKELTAHFVKKEPKYELNVEVDYMPGHRPTESVLNYIKDYYRERSISVSFHVDDKVGLDKNVTDSEFWEYEKKYNDLGNDKVTHHWLGWTNYKTTKKWKWVLYGVEREWKGVGGGTTKKASEDGGNYIFIADGTNDEFAAVDDRLYPPDKEKNIEPEEVEKVALMHELGHSIGILKLDKNGNEIPDSLHPRSVMDKVNRKNCNANPIRYSDEYWKLRNMGYYTK